MADSLAKNRAHRAWEVERWNRLLNRTDDEARAEVFRWLWDNRHVLAPGLREVKAVLPEFLEP